MRQPICAQLAFAQRAHMRVGVEQRQLAVDIVAVLPDRLALRSLRRTDLHGCMLGGTLLLKLGQTGVELRALVDRLGQLGAPARLILEAVGGLG